MEVINALGRRKSAVARVYVTTGKGNITINGRTLEEYFKEETLRYIVRQPLNVTETLTDFDIKVNLDGGGIKGQAEALRLAISRALCEINKEAYRPVLKSNGFLTRRRTFRMHSQDSKRTDPCKGYCAFVLLREIWKTGSIAATSRLTKRTLV